VLQIPYNSSLNPNEFSICVYCKVEGSAGQYRSPITSRNTNSSIIRGFLIYAHAFNNWTFSTGDGTVNGWCSIAGPSVVLDQWVFICGRHDGTQIKLRVDSTDYTPVTCNFSPNTTNDTHIGAGGDEGTDFYFDGKIDQVQLFNRSLSDAEVDMVRQRILDRQV
jgi:hypothetical protein